MTSIHLIIAFTHILLSCSSGAYERVPDASPMSDDGPVAQMELVLISSYYALPGLHDVVFAEYPDLLDTASPLPMDFVDITPEVRQSIMLIVAVWLQSLDGLERMDHIDNIMSWVQMYFALTLLSSAYGIERIIEVTLDYPFMRDVLGVIVERYEFDGLERIGHSLSSSDIAYAKSMFITQVALMSWQERASTVQELIVSLNIN